AGAPRRLVTRAARGARARARAAGAGPAGGAAEGLGLRDVAKLLSFGERLQLLQRLVLDLADPLARDVERPPDLVERARVLAAEPVAQLEHAALAMRERAEDLAQRLLAHRRLGGLVRQRHRLVGEEVPELGLL